MVEKWWAFFSRLWEDGSAVSILCPSLCYLIINVIVLESINFKTLMTFILNLFEIF